MAEKNRQTQWLAVLKWAPLILLLTLQVNPVAVATVFGIVLEHLPQPANGSEFFDADQAVLPWFGLTRLAPFFSYLRY